MIGKKEPVSTKFTIKQAESQPKVDPNKFKFEDIYYDCMLRIASNLALIDIINLGKTSTRMESFVRSMFEKKPYFSFGLPDSDTSVNKSNLATVLQEIGVYIESVAWRGLEPSELDYLAEHCPNVKDLKLVNTSLSLRPSDVKKNKKFFVKLVTLDICCGSLFDAALKTMTCSAKLERFKLNGCHNVRGKFFSITKHSKLKVLKIHGIWSAQGNSIVDLARKIKLVKFAFNEFTFDQCLTSPPECLQELEELQLNFTSITDDKLDAFAFTDFKRLTDLHLIVYENRFRNCNNILLATSRVPTLQSLTVEGFEINANTLNCLAAFSQLQKIRFIHFGNVIGRQFFSSLHTHLPNITHLIITQYYNDGIIELAWICELILSFSNLKYFSYSFMTWELMNLILRQQLRWKWPTIEIGWSVSHSDHDIQEKVSVLPNENCIVFALTRVVFNDAQGAVNDA